MVKRKRASAWLDSLEEYHRGHGIKRWHILTPIGGIPFLGRKGIYPDGWQHVWCLDCSYKKWNWPWGARQFMPNETFGYVPKTPIAQAQQDYVDDKISLAQLEHLLEVLEPYLTEEE